MTLFKISGANQKLFHLSTILCAASIFSYLVLLMQVFLRPVRLTEGFDGNWSSSSLLLLLITSIAIILTLIFIGPAFYYYTHRKREAIIFLSEVVLLLSATIITYFYLSL
jgi:membrane protein YdbS with pleckstrin-like domain